MNWKHIICLRFLSAACGLIAALPTVVDIAAAAPTNEVRLEKQGGTYTVPVVINNAIRLNFILDSGASDVLIPGDVFLTLVRTGQ